MLCVFVFFFFVRQYIHVPKFPIIKIYHSSTIFQTIILSYSVYERRNFLNLSNFKCSIQYQNNQNFISQFNKKKKVILSKKRERKKKWKYFMAYLHGFPFPFTPVSNRSLFTSYQLNTKIIYLYILLYLNADCNKSIWKTKLFFFLNFSQFWS